VSEPDTPSTAPPAARTAATLSSAAAPLPAAPAASSSGRPNVVDFTKVTKRFGDLTVIRDVTFSVPDLAGKGEFVCIIGPSGCGKSTVLRLIAGLRPQYPATEGTVLVSGKPVSGPGADRSMVFQDYTSFDNRTVEDNVAFGLEIRGMPARERRARAREWINRVGLDVERDASKYPHELSGGMRQRVAIARTLALSPRIILMDEPFGALDPVTRLHMQGLLVELWRDAEATVFFVTHSIEEAVYLGDRVYVFSSGPGTILKQMHVPPPDRPPKEMQRDPDFMKYVFEIRDIIDTLQSSTRAGDE
jgi:NitT/TauT family transport system ATP-binding protein